MRLSLPPSHPFLPSDLTPHVHVNQKSLSSSLPVTHKSARGQSHVQLAAASESSRHTHKSPALKHQTGILFNLTFFFKSFSCFAVTLLSSPSLLSHASHVTGLKHSSDITGIQMA